ncbi:hypothetical protein CIK76_03640, partial [Glutamicibacter sp. BW80]|uniref:hypothetical protein n=2 Tax=unclassified Glutamicibacter TaxID=2627139 RepID=UPI000BDBDEA0
MSTNNYFAPVSKLLAGFEKVGIVLRPAERKTQIYIWQVEGCAVYVGKKSDKAMRAVQERNWVAEKTVLENYEIPFVRTMRRLNAQPVEYIIGSVDLDVLRNKIFEHRVKGFKEAIAELQDKETLSNAEIETALIRAIVQAGYVLANSSGAGLWDGALRQAHLIGSLTAWANWGTDDDFLLGLSGDLDAGLPQSR